MGPRTRPLRESTVVVTGASRGIGAATARRLAAGGARVALLGRDCAALEELSATLPGSAWFTADVRDMASLDRAAAAVRDRFGRVDAVVANAGINRTGTLRHQPADDFAAVLDTNVTGTYRTARAFLPALLDSRGYLLLVSSVASSAGLGGQNAYAASKSALEMLAHTIRMETRHLGLRVGSVHPWFADTAMLREGEQGMPSFALVRRVLSPLGRIPGPLGLAGLTLRSDQVGQACADMVRVRARRRHVPRSAGLLWVGRPVLQSGPGLQVQQLMAGWLMRRIDQETASPHPAADPGPPQPSTPEEPQRPPTEEPQRPATEEAQR